MLKNTKSGVELPLFFLAVGAPSQVVDAVVGDEARGPARGAAQADQNTPGLIQHNLGNIGVGSALVATPEATLARGPYSTMGRSDDEHK